MNGVEIAALSAVAIWLAALSVILLLVMRQMSLMTIRLGTAVPDVVPDDHGPRVGSVLPEDSLRDASFASETFVLALLSTSCSPCREFAKTLSDVHTEGGVLFAIAGEEQFADDVIALLPQAADAIKGDVATNAAVDLGIELMPFGLRIEGRRITAKMFLRTPEDIQQLVYYGSGPNGENGEVNGNVDLPVIAR